ncbi:MAG TPA: 3-isopropylmalate dehydratase small subunit [Armatimonadetes bacterium]|nr:3-isopropylmalate dehydratase small subunit [Armatimonadota bacterium]
MVIRGRVLKFGDNIDTDVIIPARYLVTTDPKELGAHCMEPLRPNLAEEAEGRGIIVAGRNFGCGSSREHAPLAILGAGIRAVVAESFARIFFRNAINRGLPVFVSPEASREAEEGDELEIDAERGTIRNLAKGTEHRVEPFPPFIREIIEAGGLVEWLRRRGGGRG